MTAMKPQTNLDTASGAEIAAHTPCIEWQGARDEDGYGRVNHTGKWRGAHRVAWEEVRGTIPDGLVIDHLCRNRVCVNLAHLELVTSAENTRRGLSATKTHCCHGHPLSGENLMVRPNGTRACRECGRIRWRAYRSRKIEAGTWTRR